MLRITIFFLFILIVQNYLIDTVYTAYPKIATSSDIINDGSALGVPS